MTDSSTGRSSEEAPQTADRPRVFTPGTSIGMHLRVERLVRLAGDRVVYLVNNRNPRWHAMKCWSCGNKHSPPNAQACTYCSKPLLPRRFIMTARWDPASSMEYQAYAHRRLSYRSLGSPLALYRYQSQLLACFAWDNDQLLIGEPAPLPTQTVLSLAFQLSDALASLHAHGVWLKSIDASQILVHPKGSVRLFDLEVSHLVDRPLPANDDATMPPLRDLRELASLLTPWVTPDATEVLSFLQDVRRGRFRTADELSAAISTFAGGRSEPQRRPPAGAMTDTGIVREQNEDAWGWRQLSIGASPICAYVVADGMGGHESGATASQLATRTVLRTLHRGLAATPTTTPPALEKQLRAAMEAANQAVVAVNAERGTNMGTTTTALVRSGMTVVIANLGDSRAYLLRGGALRQITEDHSMVAARVAAGTLTPEEARNHPNANVLLHYMGCEAEADPDLYLVDGKPGDRFLLCSDGLWGEVGDPRLATLLGEYQDPRRTVRHLIRAANDAGGKDNVTAMVIDIPRAKPSS